MKIIALAFCLVACGQPQQGEPGPAGPPGPTGAVGETGTMGATGARGATGATGSVLGIQAKLFCSKIVGPLQFMYYTALFDNGTRYVSCQISDNLSSFQAANFYATGQPGLTTGYCALVYDIDTASSGFWAFTMAPAQAQYNDVGSADNGDIVSFATSDCGI